MTEANSKWRRFIDWASDAIVLRDIVLGVFAFISILGSQHADRSALKSVLAVAGVIAACYCVGEVAWRIVKARRAWQHSKARPQVASELPRIDQSRLRIRRMADCIYVPRAFDAVPIVVGQVFGPKTSWEVETRNALRGLVKPEVVEAFDATLKEPHPEAAAKCFLESLAITVEERHLL